MGKRLRDVKQINLDEDESGICCKKIIDLHPDLFKENCLSQGGVVKATGQVLKEHSISICRIFYLDRLDRNPVQWGVFPRIKVWTMRQIRKAAKEDRTQLGDFGRLGLLNVAYGEPHCRIARDVDAPLENVVLIDISSLIVSTTERKQRKVCNAIVMPSRSAKRGKKK